MDHADLDRLNELHADATGFNCTLQAEQRFREAMEAEWPGIYRELTKAHAARTGPSVDSRGCGEESVKMSLPLIVGDPVIIYTPRGETYGIRDASGFILFFPLVTHFQDQDDRFRHELDRRRRQAECVLKALVESKKAGVVEASRETD